MSNLNHRLSVRLDDTDYHFLSAAAKANGKSRGEFLRNLLHLVTAFRDVHDIKDALSSTSSRHKQAASSYRNLDKLDEVYPVLYRTSNNLNQIAKAENSHAKPYVDQDTLLDLKKSLKRTYAIVKKAVR